MGRISEMFNKSEESGYTGNNLTARVCQDIILNAIAKSTLNRNVTETNSNTAGFVFQANDNKADMMLCKNSLPGAIISPGYVLLYIFTGEGIYR